MQRYLLIVVLNIMSLSVNSQLFTKPDLPVRSKDIEGFIPEPWEKYQVCMGDINGNGYEDMVLIIYNRKSIPAHKPSLMGKVLIIAFYDPEQDDYYLVERSDEFLNPYNSNWAKEDHFKRFDFDQNYNLIFHFQLIYSGGGIYQGYMDYTFRYNNEQFELIRIESDRRMFNSGLSIIDYLKGEIVISDFDSKQNKLVTRKGKFKIEKLNTLGSMRRPGIVGKPNYSEIIWEDSRKKK